MDFAWHLRAFINVLAVKPRSNLTNYFHVGNLLMGRFLTERLLTSHSRLKRRNNSSLSNFDFCSGTTRGILKKNLGFGCSYNPIVSYGIIPAKSFIILINLFIFFSCQTRIKNNWLMNTFLKRFSFF